MSGSESVGDVPGLWSVATARGTPAARKAATGGSFVSRRKWKAPGSSIATLPAVRIAAIPSSPRYSR